MQINPAKRRKIAENPPRIAACMKHIENEDNRADKREAYQSYYLTRTHQGRRQNDI